MSLLQVGSVLQAEGLPIDPDTYVTDNLKWGMVHVAYHWSLGLPFSSIIDMTEVLEGSIVRCLNRLDECLTEVQHVAKVAGDAELWEKCGEAGFLIRRDVCFSPSLYLT